MGPDPENRVGDQDIGSLAGKKLDDSLCLDVVEVAHVA
jgi:hypothetical protein